MPEGFEGWYRREHPRLVGLLAVQAGDVEVAEEAVSEAFVRAFERWDRVADMAEPEGWVYRVAVNVLKRRHRRRRVERVLLLRERSEPQPPPALDGDVWEAVRRLAPRQRQAVALRYVGGLTEAEVAERMGVAVGTVSATLHHARRNLEAHLSDLREAQDV